MSNEEMEVKLPQLIEDARQYEQVKKVMLDAAGHYTFVYEKFSNGQIDECLHQCARFIAAYPNRRAMNEKKFFDYLNLHIVLHFSRLTDEKELPFEQKIALFEAILNSDYTETIFNAFDREQVAKVYTRVMNKFEQLTELARQNEDIKAALQDRLDLEGLENESEIRKLFFEKSKA